ncbi:GntR family transcriptional regulator [Paenibacillus sp. R14(2021)]|uniref:GntR family transcriptional regulator n=1 Tax=Paenibacillus sp. R14(2021) TaxID=2859228 RepID=UPI001C615C34|nr:GntR family transcriptional regulator [Paenibacillus sp. R14(2021)]
MPKNQLSRYVLTDELHVLLKQKIITHDMAAGDRINIDKLARDLGVSNIPIREALFRLSSEGFVTVVPFKGMFVAEMNLKDIDEIFEIRKSLEELSIRNAAPRLPKPVLHKILEELAQPPEVSAANEEEGRMLRMNEGLHGTLLAYADNMNLLRLVTSLIERIYRYLNVHHYKIELPAERTEHEAIVQALLDEDTERAVEAMRVHLQNAHKRLRESFA